MKTLLEIKEPCNEKWESMKIGLHSRHCQNCNKDVVDFTKKDRIEILQYILFNYDKRICGHIYPNQLDFTKQDILITINTLNEKTKNSNLSFYLLTFSTLLLASCHSQNDIISSNKSQIDTIQKKTQIIFIKKVFTEMLIVQ